MSELVKERLTVFQSGRYFEGFVQASWQCILGRGTGASAEAPPGLGLLCSRKPQACWKEFRGWQVDHKRRRQREQSEAFLTCSSPPTSLKEGWEMRFGGVERKKALALKTRPE